MSSIKKNAVAVALGAVVVGGAFAGNAEANPFAVKSMLAGYQLVGGEGHCGGDSGRNCNGKAGEGGCGGKAGEGGCGSKAGSKKNNEGKCGVGKCGAMR